MKTIKTLAAITLCTGLMLSATSCFIVRKDNGNHKGHTKNTNNPHHPNTTNPGHTKDKSQGNGKNNSSPGNSGKNK